VSSGWWIADYWQAGETVLLASWIFWVIVSICLHELGHGVAALWEGDDTPRVTGHMTMNPLVHMGGMSLVVFLLVGFAWGLMPVNPSRFRHRRWGDAIVAGAGPAVNLVLAFVLLTAAGMVSGLILGKDGAPAWGERVFVFLYTGGWLNLALMALNLLPVPPLDGSRILASASAGYQRLLMHPNAQIFGLAIFMLVFWITPFGSTVLGLLQSVALLWVGLVQGVFI